MDLSTVIVLAMIIFVVVRVVRRIQDRNARYATGQADPGGQTTFSLREQREQSARIRRALDRVMNALENPRCDKTTITGGGWGPEHIHSIAEFVGPAFQVYWRTPSSGEVFGAGIVIERHPTFTQPLTGIPTEDGRIIIDPTNEPLWMVNARANGWDIFYDDHPRPDGTVSVYYRRKNKPTAESWWNWWTSS